MNESSSSSDDDAFPSVLVVLETDCAWWGVDEGCLYISGGGMGETFVISKGSVFVRTRIAMNGQGFFFGLPMVGLCTQCDIGTVPRERPSQTMARILRPWVEDYSGG